MINKPNKLISNDGLLTIIEACNISFDSQIISNIVIYDVTDHTLNRSITLEHDTSINSKFIILWDGIHFIHYNSIKHDPKLIPTTNTICAEVAKQLQIVLFN